MNPEIPVQTVPQPQPVILPVSQNPNIPATPLPLEKKKSSWLVASIVIVIFVVISAYVTGYILLQPSNTPRKAASYSGGMPQAKETDLAPDVPLEQKTSVIVEHSDSKMEKYLMPQAQVEQFTKSLPLGDRVYSSGK